MAIEIERLRFIWWCLLVRFLLFDWTVTAT